MGKGHSCTSPVNVSSGYFPYRGYKSRVAVKCIDNPFCRIPIEGSNPISVIARECMMVVVETFAVGQHGEDEVPAS